MRARRAARPLAAMLVATMLVAACAPVERRPGAERAAPDSFELLQPQYAALAKAGQPVFEVDTARSVVLVEVRRGGALARLGHDHVVASRDIHGFIAPDGQRADLVIGLGGLSVDEPGLRAAAGFDTRPSPEDVAATRENMLSKVLRVDGSSVAIVRVAAIRPADDRAALSAQLTLNGVTRPLQVDARVESSADELRVTGRAAIVQTDYGIVPFAILGGAIQVEDALTVRLEVRARRVAP